MQRKTRRNRRRRIKTRKQFRKSFRKQTRRGGNYERDATITELQGIPIKGLHRTVIAFPGGVMSAAQYERYMEDQDRNGYDLY